MFRLGQTALKILPAALILYLSLPAPMSAGVTKGNSGREPQKIQESRGQAPGPPLRFELEQNFPNPFKNWTAIGYTVRIGEKPVKVTIEILDARGRCVRTLVDDLHNPGQYSFCWLGTDDKGKELESGTYFCRLRAEDREVTRQVVISK